MPNRVLQVSIPERWREPIIRASSADGRSASGWARHLIGLELRRLRESEAPPPSGETTLWDRIDAAIAAGYLLREETRPWRVVGDTVVTPPGRPAAVAREALRAAGIEAPVRTTAPGA